MMKMKMVLVCLLCFLCSAMTGDADVSYDGRSLMFNGTRKILFSGSIHYPRSTPQMWPSLIAKSKQGGLDVIQTYVFWNMHEPKQGQHNFEGRLDLVSFIKEIQSQGLYVSLRIGPFIESEWQYGGLPLWLHDVPGIVFRSDNEPFKIHMQNFTTKIVNMMKAEGLYASQGGPIILSQIENEYKNVEGAFHERGPPYVQWAADMAVGLQTGVPWVMCKQPDAPDPVINACNGMNCGETFTGPNSPNKPAVWTENWTSFYQVFGEEPFLRSAEDIAFAVALWIAKNGSFVNYYMYHGGTNFARTGSAFVTTSYYDQAPLDEYGLIRQPKWGHLRELHIAIKQGAEPLLSGTPTNFSLGQQQNAYVFQGNLGCIAFLSNSDKRTAASVQFQNSTYELPRRSISILSDCKNVIFNTAKVNAQYGERSVSMAQNLDAKESWEEFMDGVPSFAQASFKTNALSDQIGVAKDDTDYLWYSISYDHATNDSGSKLHVDSRGHVVHAFVNGKHMGTAHGSHKNPITTLEAPISLIAGNNNISLLSVLVGLPDSGAFMERKVAGLRKVIIQDNNNRSEDISTNSWGYQIGLLGEQLGIYAQDGLEKVNWKSIGDPQQPLTWYKTLFDAPEGNGSVVLNLGSMGKGEAWINGENIGRYWISFNTPKGRPSQTLYHVPRSFLKPSGNLLVLFEEIGGDPLQISFGTPTISRICGSVSDKHLPPVWSLGKKRNSQSYVHLQCPRRRTISSIEFASFGTPLGDCASYSTGSCHSVQSRSVAEEACLGKNGCSMTVSADKFGEDPCPGTSKSLLVVANCS